MLPTIFYHFCMEYQGSCIASNNIYEYNIKTNKTYCLPLLVSFDDVKLSLNLKVVCFDHSGTKTTIAE